jgi:uroporphyrinogen III methyltransferase/synthase
MKSRVSIVGVGPGDPGLITLKGIERIKKADVILYDRLIPRSILKYRRGSCILQYIGKKKGKAIASQDQINGLLLKYAKSHKNVVRLKGGDPFVFGRGREEELFLKGHNVDCEVISGVSSFYAALGASGIPITHRGIASSFLVVTGHEAPSGGSGRVDWEYAAGFNGTLVVMMGKSNLDEISQKLLCNGMKGDTPCAVVSRGTTTGQGAVYGTISNIADKASSLPPPAVTVIGSVVKLGNYYRKSDKPLSGSRYILTASERLNKEMSARMERLGAKIDSVPMISIDANRDYSLVDKVIENIGEYDWLVFTSRHGVIYFLKRFYHKGGALDLLEGKIACVGSGTAAQLKSAGIGHHLCPKEFTSKDLALALKDKGVTDKRVALFRTKTTKDILKGILKDSGARIADCIVYNVDGLKDKRRLKKAVSKDPDGIFFLSPKSAEEFFDSIPKKARDDIKKKSKFFSMGPVTTRALKKMGVDRVSSPKENTITGLINLCCEEAS